MSGDVGVVLVTHETLAEVLGSLGTLVDHDGPIVVVDAGSSDGTVDAISREHPRVRVLALTNVGFGPSVNAGVRLLPPTVTSLVIANADVRFLPGAVATLAATLAADPGVGVVGPLVRYPSGARQASARRSPDVLTAVLHALLGWSVPGNRWTRRYRAQDLVEPLLHADQPGTLAVDWVSGCTMAVRRDLFERLGGFDPGYRLFVEDVDLCDRIRAAGARIVFQPAAVVEHRVGASTSHRPLRARIAHARGLDRYVAQRLIGARRLARPLLWPALLGWVAATSVAGRLRGGAHSTTGEPTA
jgi:N-acetylglucosaminyl-diphospho-decaprenol L-rhamnosyltransferase